MAGILETVPLQDIFAEGLIAEEHPDFVELVYWRAEAGERRAVARIILTAAAYRAALRQFYPEQIKAMREASIEVRPNAVH